jgi:hypothetical protein
MMRTLKRVVNGSLGFIGLRIIRKGPDRVWDPDTGLRKILGQLGVSMVFARKHQSDRNAYSNAKTEFVQSVLKAAGVGLSSRTPV